VNEHDADPFGKKGRQAYATTLRMLVKRLLCAGGVLALLAVDDSRYAKRFVSLTSYIAYPSTTQNTKTEPGREHAS